MNKRNEPDAPLIDSFADMEEVDSLSLGSQMHPVEWALKKRYDSRYNIITGQVEVKKKKETKYTSLTDYLLNSIMRDFLKNGIKCTSTLLADFLNSDFSPRYDLFSEYFKNLPEWDKEDHVRKLASTIRCKNQDLWEIHLKKWLVAMVAGLLDPKVVNHTVLVLVGAQGIGKTTWLLNLVPKELQNHAFMGLVHPDNKDTIVNLSECMLIILDELETMNRKSVGVLKEVITQSQIRVRRPYARNAETLIRRASFVGSVNSIEFLNDPTGSRRFLCHEVESMIYNHEIDLAQLYSQLLCLYRSKFAYWFNDEEIAEVCKNNDQYQISTPEEEMLLKYFAPGTKENGKFYNATNIVLFLQKVTSNKITYSPNIMGKMLKKNKFERKKQKSDWGYFLMFQLDDKEYELL
ncbi:VapE domain-containing protein [Chitinophaga sp. MM2321]|uniref:VapE domain-containing protein n=1 Tax=Chitinophaga sp. MM2321 TaxID=3137178 RepID=UPI0032D585F8